MDPDLSGSPLPVPLSFSRSLLNWVPTAGHSLFQVWSHQCWPGGESVFFGGPPNVAWCGVCCMHRVNMVLAVIQPGVHHHPKPFGVLFSCFPVCPDAWSCFLSATKLCASPCWMPWGFCWPNPSILRGSFGLKLCHSACQLLPLNVVSCANLLRVQSVHCVGSWWRCWTIFPLLATPGALCFSQAWHQANGRCRLGPAA